MKLSTIWTMRYITVPERLRRTRDWAAMEVASKLPVRIKYWTTLQQLSHVTHKMPNAEIPGIKMQDILKNLETPKNLS